MRRPGREPPVAPGRARRAAGGGDGERLGLRPKFSIFDSDDVLSILKDAGGSTDNINQVYTVNASSEVANGTWKLRVNDNAGGDTGRIDSWNLTF